jgi:hypothetical protein
MVLVLVTLYAATTTANVTAVALQTAIRGLTDLPGKAVVTWVDYVDDLARYGVAAAGMPWDDAGPAEDALVDAVRFGAAAALVLNRPFLLAKTAQMCDASVLPGDFAPANQAIAFPAGFDSAPLFSVVNEALVLLGERGDALLLEQRYFDVPLPVCQEHESVDVEESIQFSQVAGLWIMLGAAALAGAALAGAYAAYLHWPRLRVVAAGAAVARGGESLCAMMRARRTASRGEAAQFA